MDCKREFTDIQIERFITPKKLDYILLESFMADWCG